MSSESPKVIMIRKEIYDPSLERFVNVELPTQTVNRARKLNTLGVNAAFASHYVGSGTAATGAGTVGVGSVGRIVNISVTSTQSNHFYMKDRKGTLGFIFLPSAGGVRMVADSMNPYKIVEGTFVISTMASLSGGTYTVDFEIVKRSQKV